MKVTQGYVAYYNSTKGKWKSCWAHLSRQGLLYFPHQYVRVYDLLFLLNSPQGESPTWKYKITSQTTVKEEHVSGLSNVIEISFITNGKEESTRLALQSKIDQNRWVAAVEVCFFPKFSCSDRF